METRPAASTSTSTDHPGWRLPVTLANGITLLRILLIPVFMVFMLGLEVIPYRDTIAVVIFVLAAATDKLDGYLARSRNAVTVLGTFLDPLADKLLISAALLSLVELGRISAWIAMVIISREFAVSGLRLVAAVERVVIPASGFGKFKTFSQIVAVTALILPGFGFVYGRPLSWYLINIAALITVASGIDYFLKARDRLRLPGS
ncbi:MAG: CDP-diacylglycerol--glycerol-3-phosphate 3-phosphatidyltransferase [Gaiellales bacterium]|nr:MAG: CDP-diacylglycerol--glycerol-3-phosphate 3-phosphatidyltransferase [Gaiellales bacterium]